MINHNSKRVAAYAISYIPVDDARIISQPGNDEIKVQGDFIKLDASEIFYIEKKVKDGYEVELKVKITDTSNSSQSKLNRVINKDVVCLLHTTDFAQRVVGCADCPINFDIERLGTTSYFSLIYKGVQPEMIKFLSPFEV